MALEVAIYRVDAGAGFSMPCITLPNRRAGGDNPRLIPGIENWSHRKYAYMRTCTPTDQILLLLYRELVTHNLPRPERGVLV